MKGLLLLLVVVAAAPLPAQRRPPSLKLGDTVRVTLASQSSQRAVVAGIDGGSYVLRTTGRGDTLLSLAPNVTRLERYEGRRSRLRSTGQGALWGAAIGAVTGAMAGAILWDPDEFLSAETRGGEAAFGAAAFATLATPVGAFIGLARSTTRWREVPREATVEASAGPTLRVAPRRDGVAIALSFSVR